MKAGKMGFRPAGPEGKLGRSRSFNHLQENLVKVEPPPVRTGKRASWAAPLPCKQKVDSLPVTQGGYERSHEGGLLSPVKKGGWKKESRRWGRVVFVLVLLVLMVAAVIRTLLQPNQNFVPTLPHATTLAEPRVRPLLGSSNWTAKPTASVKVNKHKSKSKSHGHSGHGSKHSTGQVSEKHIQNARQEPQMVRQEPNEVGQVSVEKGQVAEPSGQLSTDFNQLSAAAGHVSAGSRQVSSDYGQVSSNYGQVSAEYGQVSRSSGQVSDGLEQPTARHALLLQRLLWQRKGGDEAEVFDGHEQTGEVLEVRGTADEGENKGRVLGANGLLADVRGRVAGAGWWRGVSRLNDVGLAAGLRKTREARETGREGARATSVEGVAGEVERSANGQRNTESNNRGEIMTWGGSTEAEKSGAREEDDGTEPEEQGTGKNQEGVKSSSETEMRTVMENETGMERGGDLHRTIAETEAENQSGASLELELELWKAPDTKGFRPCLAKIAAEEPPYIPQGYLMVQCNGGLNQQRDAICNAVALARYLNMTLLVPYLQAHPVWNDHTKFHDLFDLEHFIKSLDGHVRVERAAPPAAFGGNLETVRNIPRNAPLDWYDANVRHPFRPNTSVISAESTALADRAELVPRNASARVVWLKPFAKRLDNNLPRWLQKSRCKANYEALKFSPAIERLAAAMSTRMRAAAGGRPWVAVHLRYEIDMVAYSMCTFGGGKAEQEVLHEYRMTHWDVALRRSRERRSPESQRLRGQCPLTPEEAALFIRAMGFDENTHIYLATHDQQLYGGPDSLAPFKALFPLTSSKADLLDAADLAALQKRASSLAALDYVMGRAADVFIPTATGNMPNLIMGHRMYDGFKKTIEPHHRKLAALFAQRNSLPWDSIAEQIRTEHQLRNGGPSNRPKTSNFYANPSECFCQNSDASSDVSGTTAVDVSDVSRMTETDTVRMGASVTSERVFETVGETAPPSVVGEMEGHGFDM